MDFFINQYIQAADELRTVLVAVHVIIAVGVSLLIFGIIGIYGAARPKIWALILYLICLVCVTLVLLSGAIYCYVFRIEIKNSVKNSDVLKKALINSYGSNSAVTSAFNFMQKELHCCGGTSYTDYAESQWILSVCIGLDDPSVCEQLKNEKVPASCCSNSHFYEGQGSMYQFCPMYKTNPGQGGQDNTFKEAGDWLYTTSCRESIVKFLDDQVLTVLGLGLSIAVLVVLLLAIFLTSALIHKLRRPEMLSNHDDDVVYEMARSQEKSPYPTRGPYANLYNS